MNFDESVVLDANVLATFPVADLLLRLAETPRAYRPFWSQEILDEVRRTQVQRLNWPPALAESFANALRTYFPESMVRDFEPLLPYCTNDPKDRHVLACAIKAKAGIILTYNLCDFQPEALAPHGVVALHPQDFLIKLRKYDVSRVNQVVRGIAIRRGISKEQVFSKLQPYLPGFFVKGERGG